MSDNQGWVEAFEQEKWLLKEVLGEFIVEVHHVGSTVSTLNSDVHVSSDHSAVLHIHTLFKQQKQA